MSDFLLEIGLEEIPARMIAGAEVELGRRVYDLLTRERLLGSAAKLTTYSTPRRLAALVEDVAARQADAVEQLTGPSWKVAFKEGAPTAAAEAFAKKAGVAVTELAKVTTAKGEYVGATVKRPGRAAADILASDLPKEVAGLYWAKNMYWRAGKPERFVRPVRWVVALLGADVVPMEIAGIAAGRASRGHRVLHGDAPVVVNEPKQYRKSLRSAYVMTDVAERRHSIRKALDAATRTIAGARWREDEPLVDTVVHLTEWPTVLLGNFDREFLTLPEEVLVTVMRDHQKYFAVEDADGKLAPHFLTVLNTQVDDAGLAIIRHGNERVLTSRFKDARFFWDFDQKTPLVDRVESLRKVTFFRPPTDQDEPRMYDWKARNNWAAAECLAAKAISGGAKVDVPALRKAAELSKTDLTAELVKEFTELQGIIGGLYARAQGLGDKVGDAIYDQYTPASIEDRIPKTVEGQILGIADRIQTIVYMFGIGMAPTGSKDPFALRRAANAIVKILAESSLSLTLRDVLESYTGIVWADKDGKRVDEPSDIYADQTLTAASAFLRERLHFYLKDVRGYAYDVVNAVLAAGADDVRDAMARAHALTTVRGSEDFAAISAAFKRIKNILLQAAEKQFPIGLAADAILAPEAQRLSDAAGKLAPEVAELRQRRAYVAALALIATLRPAVDGFFDKVMVLDNDPSVRGANLALIEQVLRQFSGIADFSEMVTA